MALDLSTSDSARNRVRVKFQCEPNREAGESFRTVLGAGFFLVEERRVATQQLLFCKEEKFRLFSSSISIIIGTKSTGGK